MEKKDFFLKNKRTIKVLKYFSTYFIVLGIEFVLISLFIDNMYIAQKMGLLRGRETSIFILISAVIFLILFQRSFKDIKLPKKQSKTKFFCSLSTNIVLFILFYKLNKFLISNISTITENLVYYKIAWFALGLSVPVSLLFAFFDLKYLDYIRKEIKMPFIVSLLYGLIFFILSDLSQRLWYILSKTIGVSIYFLLNLFFQNVIYEPNHKIGIYPFIVQIGAPCSGIEGMGLFLLLFTFFVFVQLNVIDISKAVILGILGVVGSFLLNIFRIFSLILVGYFISPGFAVGTFHSNAGWILFTGYFLTFLYFAYPKIIKKK